MHKNLIEYQRLKIHKILQKVFIHPGWIKNYPYPNLSFSFLPLSFFILLTGVFSFEILFSSDLRAEETVLEEVVVTANKIQEPIRNVPYTLDVIDSEELKEQSLQTVAEALRDIAGVDIGARGPKGEDTDIRMRGSDRDEVLVLLDGIPINGNNESRSYFIDLLPVDAVERIEILKGSQSILYGSDAIGGVINVITRRAKPGKDFSFRWDLGSFKAFRETVTASGGNERNRAFASFSRDDNGGHLSRSRLGSNAFSGTFTHYLTPDFVIEFGAHFIQADQQILKNQIVTFGVDGVLNDYVIDDSNTDRSLYFTTDFVQISTPITSFYDTKLVYGFSFLREKILNSNSGDAPVDETGAALDPTSQHFRSHSYRHYLDWLNNFDVLKIDERRMSNTFQWGFSLVADHLSFINNSFEGDVGAGLPFSSAYPTPGAKANRQNYSIYFQNNFNWGGFTASGGMRFDRNTTFGDAISPRAALSYEFEKTKTKLKATYSEGFHAPTIAEFFDATIGGTATALPIRQQQELSQSYEIGAEQELWDGKVYLRSVYFFIDYDRLLDIVEAMDDASSWGIENDFKVSPWDFLKFGGNYTFNRTHNDDDGSELTQRPRHYFNFFAAVKPLKGLSIRSDVHYVSSKRAPDVVSLTIGDLPIRFFDSDGRTRDRVAGHVSLDLSANYRLPPLWKAIQAWEVYVRGINLLDDQYEESVGYPMPGIQFYAGTKIDF